MITFEQQAHIRERALHVAEEIIQAADGAIDDVKTEFLRDVLPNAPRYGGEAAEVEKFVGATIAAALSQHIAGRATALDNRTREAFQTYAGA